MISLKKNDKIIVIVAVAILVIAGVAIATYQSPKTPETLPPTTTGEKTFEVVWAVRNGTLIGISEFAGKKSQYETTVMIPEGNLKSITFNLSWADDHMTLLKRMGLDSLTLEVTTPDGVTFTETSKSAPITGKGNITYTVATDIIPPVSFKAVDEKTAQAKLKEKPYYDDSWSNKNIKINVSVQIGELRILKKMRDKGNSFELKISYQYYDGILNEDTTKNTGGDPNTTPPPDDPWVQEPPYISMIINTGSGRYI
ncbi:MAG TPA: hypothetical protein DSN98_07390 [Thermoplasmata archaeon]|jgi:hypothetical protein|nr:MAG TPA: hypothetical protein DSN98_07390 [Thermoplasmata archaeon]